MTDTQINKKYTKSIYIITFVFLLMHIDLLS
jgi:hypothetical protein